MVLAPRHSPKCYDYKRVVQAGEEVLAPRHTPKCYDPRIDEWEALYVLAPRHTPKCYDDRCCDRTHNEVLAPRHTPKCYDRETEKVLLSSTFSVVSVSKTGIHSRICSCAPTVFSCVVGRPTRKYMSAYCFSVMLIART